MIEQFHTSDLYNERVRDAYTIALLKSTEMLEAKWMIWKEPGPLH